MKKRDFSFAIIVVTIYFLINAEANAPNAQILSSQNPRLYCSTVDVRNRLTPEIKSFFMSARNQGDTNWCYAYTTADLVSFELAKPISAMQIAINYNSRLSSFDRLWRRLEAWISNYKIAIWDGGFVSVALKASMNQEPGLCEEVYVSSSLGTDNFKLKMSEISLFLNNKKTFPDETIQSLGSIFKKLKSTEIKNVVTSAKQKKQGLNQVMEQLIQLSCKDSYIKIPDYEIQNFNRWFHDLWWVIHSRLNKEQPMGLVYDSTVSHLVTEQEETILTGIVPDHAVVAIGRKWNSRRGTCEILIRDSFGDDCKKIDAQKVTCNGDGTFWIDEEKLLNKVYFITNFKPRTQKRKFDSRFSAQN